MTEYLTEKSDESLARAYIDLSRHLDDQPDPHAYEELSEVTREICYRFTDRELNEDLVTIDRGTAEDLANFLDYALYDLLVEGEPSAIHAEEVERELNEALES